MLSLVHPKWCTANTRSRFLFDLSFLNHWSADSLLKSRVQVLTQIRQSVWNAICQDVFYSSWMMIDSIGAQVFKHHVHWSVIILGFEQVHRGVAIEVLQEGHVIWNLGTITFIWMTDLVNFFKNITFGGKSVQNCITSRQNVVDEPLKLFFIYLVDINSSVL